MRELKFRAWDKEEKTMRMVRDIHFDNHGNCEIEFECIDYLNREYENIELEQYTGLKDKNGKEIYEGDIVDTGVGVGVVKWRNELCAFEIVNEANNFYVVMGVRKDKYEVIGNIHEQQI